VLHLRSKVPDGAAQGPLHMHCTTISAMAMKCALGICFQTLATNSAFTPTMYLDELSRGPNTNSFAKSNVSMATCLNDGI